MKIFSPRSERHIDQPTQGYDLVLKIGPTRSQFFVALVTHLLAIYSTVSLLLNANLITLVWIAIILNLFLEFAQSRRRFQLRWSASNQIALIPIQQTTLQQGPSPANPADPDSRGSGDEISSSDNQYSGILTADSFQCHWYIVLDYRDAAGKRGELTVWRDSVTEMDYRILRFRLGMLKKIPGRVWL